MDQREEGRKGDGEGEMNYFFNAPSFHLIT